MYKTNFSEVGKVVIYGDGKIFFESERDLTKIGCVSSLDRLMYVNISDPKQARKENLFRNDNFFLKYTDNHHGYWSERKTALYIHVSDIAVSGPVEKIAMQHNGETDYKEEYTLTFTHGARIRKVNLEKMNVAGNWTPPEGAHWKRGTGDYNNTYEVKTEEEIKAIEANAKKKGIEFEPYNVIHWFITEENVTECTRESDYFTRIERDNDRKNREDLAKKFNDVLRTDRFSHYDIEKLLSRFEIKEKNA